MLKKKYPAKTAEMKKLFQQAKSRILQKKITMHQV